jgi:predicted ATPase
MEIASEHQLGFWPPTELVIRGWVLAQQGRVLEGISQIRQGITEHEEMRQPLHLPYALVLLARAYDLAKEPANGLSTLTKAKNLMDSTGIRFLESEVHRIRGELLLVQDGGESEAESCFRRALEVARCQSAEALRLRAAIQLSLLHRREKNSEPRRELQQVLARFTEGFETTDLVRAATLLEELS